VGPLGLKYFINSRLIPLIGDYSIPFKITAIELSHNEQYRGSFYSATAVRLNHPKPSTGYLFNVGNTKCAITGDTGYCDNLHALLGQADIAIMEWSYSERPGSSSHISDNDMLQLSTSPTMPQKIYDPHVSAEWKDLGTID
jgi:ribonuclease BN (tRNA processing enzyme)